MNPASDEATSRAALELVEDGMIVVDAGGRVRSMNPSAERLTGWSVADGLGQRVEQVVDLRGSREGPPLVHPGRAAHHSPEHGLISVGAWISQRGGGWVRVRVRARSVAGSEPLVVLVIRDLSEGFEFQELLARADRLASMGTMAASIAHEINNPLTYMLLNVEAAMEEINGHPTLGPVVGTALKDIEIGAQAIERIVHDLKLLATPTRRSDEAVQVARVLRRTQRLAAKFVRARGRFEASLPVTQPVFADAVALGQVVTNLVLNAAQALPDHYSDDHVVRLSCEDLVDTVIIEVTDNGSGIPEEIRDRVFDPFFTTKGVGRGTGLGLAICHQIVADLDGRIEVESTVGVGTTMRVVLPTTSVVPDDDDVEEYELRDASWPRRRVLLVDDDASVRRAMASGLRRVHLVDAVESVDRAVERLSRGYGYDAILCDLMMSPRSGLELLEELAVLAPDLIERSAFVTGGVFSGSLQAEVLRAGRPVAYKPFNSTDLFRLVESLAQA